MANKTLAYLRTIDETQKVESISGNATRFNVITKNGRFFDKQLNRVIPFSPAIERRDEIDVEALSLSLHESNIGLTDALAFQVCRIVDSGGRTSRYVLYDAVK